MSSTYRLATAGQAFQVRYSTSQSLSGLFVQAKIYNASDTLVTTVNLTESLSQTGRYVGTGTINTEGDYEIFYIAYTDSNHTVESDTAPRQSESLTVTITQSTFGGATLPPSGGITDNDINAIIDGVIKKLGYVNPWKLKLTNGNTAEEELMNKSELQEVKIPKLDLSKLDKLDSLGELVEKKMDKFQNELSSLKPKDIDFQPVLLAIKKIGTLSDLKLPDNKKELNDNFKILKKGLEEVLNKPVKEVDLGPLVKGLGEVKDLIEKIKIPDNTVKFLEQFGELKGEMKESAKLIKHHDEAEYKRAEYVINFIKEVIKSEVEKILEHSVKEMIKIKNLNSELIRAIKNEYED